MSEIGDSMIQGALEALAFAKGQADLKDYRIHIPEAIDVKRIRGEFKMSQSKIAEFFGFSMRTLQEWEQGRSIPRGVAKHFLLVLQKEPDAVCRALTEKQ